MRAVRDSFHSAKLVFIQLVNYKYLFYNQIQKFFLIIFILNSFFYTPFAQDFADDCSLIPEVELGISYEAYKNEKMVGGLEEYMIAASPERLANGIHDIICKFNDVIFRINTTNGESLTELKDNHIIRNERFELYPFYLYQKPDRNISFDQFRIDINNYANLRGFPFSITFKSLVLDKISYEDIAVVRADYEFTAPLDFKNDVNVILSDKIIKRSIDFEIKIFHDRESDKLYFDIKNIVSDKKNMTTRSRVGYSNYYIHGQIGTSIFLSGMSDYWESMGDTRFGISSESQGLASIYGWSTKEMESFSIAPSFLWGIEMGKAFNIGLSAHHGLDFSVNFNFTQLKIEHHSSDTAIFSVNHYPNISSDSSITSTSRYIGVGNISSSTSAILGGLRIGYRYNWINSRRVLYVSPSLHLQGTSIRSGQWVESANLGWVSLYEFGDSRSYHQTIEDESKVRTISNIKSTIGIFGSVGLGLGFELPVDNNGKVYFSGRISAEFPVFGSMLAHPGNISFDQSEDTLSSDRERNSYAASFTSFVRPVIFNLNIGLSFLIWK